MSDEPLICDHAPCNELATHFYTLPGRPEAPTCAEHLQMHRNIAYHASLQMTSRPIESAPDPASA